jgi:outer membrane receptor protein involved in Fe transport
MGAQFVRRGALLSATAISLVFVVPTDVRAADAAGKPAAVSEVVVTAQRQSENLQTVPIAVSAISSDDMLTKRLDTAQDMQKVVPNLNFTRTVTGGYDITIRGIGNKAATDPAVGLHVNNAPLTYSRLADADLYDVERVEVLRGPQGTLYGRNASAGVFNIITAKPGKEFAAAISGEYGNYDTARLKGFVNLPLGDMLAVRLAGTYLDRKGFATNEVGGGNIDGRHLWSGRLSVKFEPTTTFRADAMFEHFDENDDRVRYQKQLCISDPGPASVGGVPTTQATRNFLNQGCSPGSIYSPAALGQVNTTGTLGGVLAGLAGLTTGDVNAGRLQSSDLRTFPSFKQPFYRAKNNLAQLNLEYDLTGNLTLSSLGSYDDDNYVAYQDYFGAIPTGTFNVTPLTPGGVFNDPQLGPSNTMSQYGGFGYHTTQWSEELRLRSSFSGPLNFSGGAIYFESQRSGFYNVLGNTITAFSLTRPTVFIDTSPNIPVSGIGHNYYYNPTDEDTKSKAAFGEAYWRPTDTLKITGGLRWTQDDKVTRQPIALGLLQPGQGLLPIVTTPLKYTRTTGRLAIDWSPKLSFTDSTLFYASYATGFKAGGVNGAGAVPATYGPEDVTAYEAGMKNELFDRTLVFNAGVFYYRYKGYQINKPVNRVALIENIDADIKGAEIETIWRPTEPLQFNASVGLLDTNVTNGSSLDLFDRTQGDPTVTYVKASNGAGCVVPTATVAATLARINSGAAPASSLLAFCSAPTANQGNPVNLKGRQIPLAPHNTVNVGVQYQWDLAGDWKVRLRGEYYRQSSSFARVFNTTSDYMKPWDNTTLSVTVSQPSQGWDIQAYVKNVFDKNSITDIYYSDEGAGFTRNIFVLEPRTYGIVVSKRFE